MPRTINDGSNGTLLRTVLSKTPLTLNASSDSEKNATKSSSGFKDVKDYKKRASALLLHRRSHSVQADIADVADVADNTRVDFRSRRQKSLSHLELLNKLTTSRFTISPTTSHSSDHSPISPISTRKGLEDGYGKVIDHGEVTLDGASWRRRTEYLVLTHHTLWRFRNSKKAVEAFPQIIPSGSASNADFQNRPKTSASPMSPTDVDALTNVGPAIESTGLKSCIPIDQMIAVRYVRINKSRTRVEIIWYHSLNYQSQSSIFYVDRIDGIPHWLESLRSYLRDAGDSNVKSVPSDHWEMIRDKIGPESDWELRNGHVVSPVILHSKDTNAAVYSTVEAYQKDFSPLCYLIVGRSKVYIIPMAPLIRLIVGSLQSNIGAFGIISLSALSSAHGLASSLTLTFRCPQQAPCVFDFTSMHLQDVVQALHFRLEEVRPYWPIPSTISHMFDALPEKLHLVRTTVDSQQEVFVRVLQAYCRAWGIYVSSISYEIECEGEDTPKFSLLPRSSDQPAYSVIELLAVLRALRHNDYFVTVSFANVSLNKLSFAYDRHGDDHICERPSIGLSTALDPDRFHKRSLLFQEISAVAMTAIKLRRLDFTSCLNVESYSSADSAVDEQGCGVIEPLYHLCAKQNTNVDWLIFNGIRLRRADIDYVMAMFGNKDCHLRAIELSGCNLDMWSIRLLLNEMPTQSNTLEDINISNNPGRLSPDISIDEKFSSCRSLRKVDLSQLLRTNEPVSLLPIDILAAWRLEELCLSKTSLNVPTIEDLILYLQLPSSTPLKKLCLDGCGLNSDQVARIFDALTTRHARNSSLSHFHLDISNNVIESFECICSSILACSGLSSLAWRLLEIERPDDFVRFMNAICSNRSLKQLDLSQLYLDFHLSENDGSSAALEKFFATNEPLLKLNMSANNSRLHDSQLGSSLHKPLLSLSENTTLKILHIEDQAIGAHGAQSLVQVLRTNTTLRELHCDRNRIDLASFTSMVDACKHNHTLTHLSCSERDSSSPVYDTTLEATRAPRPHVLQGRTSMMTSPRKHRQPRDVLEAAQEVGTVVEEQWTHQRRRLEQYLQRNRARAVEQGQAGVLEPSGDYGDTGGQSSAATAAEKDGNIEVEEREVEDTDEEEDEDDNEGLTMPSLRSAT